MRSVLQDVMVTVSHRLAAPYLAPRVKLGEHPANTPPSLSAWRCITVLAAPNPRRCVVLLFHGTSGSLTIVALMVLHPTRWFCVKDQATKSEASCFTVR